jgi:hypothetical protein
MPSVVAINMLGLVNQCRVADEIGPDVQVIWYMGQARRPVGKANGNQSQRQSRIQPL